MKLGHLVISGNVYRGLGASFLGGLMACSAGPGPESSTPGDPNPPGTVATTLSVQGILHGTDGSPAADVTVCLRTDPLTAGKGPCTTSDRQGAWKIVTVPANANIAITFEKTAYVPTLRAISTGTKDVTISAAEGVLESDDAVAAQTGHSPDATTGSIAFFTSAPGSWQPIAATASLRPVDGPPGAPPRYDNELADAGSGTSGVFTGVHDGFFILTLGSASVRCASGGGLYGYPITLYSPPDEARMIVPVVAGFLTTPIVAVCTAAGPSPVGQ
jgi:hypothetical protein